MKNKLLLVLIILMIVVGIAGASSVTTNAAQRPVPPVIQTYGIPNPTGYAHDCGPMPTNGVSCGAICYYTETTPPALSCVPAWFLE